MRIAAHLARTLRSWLKSRPRLEIEESATWFLLLFAYAHGLTTDGLTTDGLDFKMDGIIPQLTAPQVTLAMTVFCLTVSVVVIVEPLFPCKVRAWTKRFRTSSCGQYLRGLSVFFAFALGMVAGFGLLVDKVPTMSWLIALVLYVGFLIFVLLGIKLVVSVVTGYRQTDRSGKDDGQGLGSTGSP